MAIKTPNRNGQIWQWLRQIEQTDKREPEPKNGTVRWAIALLSRKLRRGPIEEQEHDEKEAAESLGQSEVGSGRQPLQVLKSSVFRGIFSAGQRRRHLQDVIDGYNFGNRLKTLEGLSPTVHLQMAGFRTGSIHRRSNPSNAGTEHQGGAALCKRSELLFWDENISVRFRYYAEESTIWI